jgi:hypothetical protein
MSQTTDFYLSWLGNASFGGSGIRLRDQEPLVFRPTDISGCRIWLDANNNDAVQYNDLLQVSSWSNSGTLEGQFDLSGGVVTYGNVTQNGLNTVTFEPNGFMSGVFDLEFQDRSIFYVFKPNTISKPTPIFTSDITGHQELFVDVSDSWVTFTGKHPSPFPEIAFETDADYTGYAYMTTLVAGSDLSDNWSGYNGTFTAPIYQSAASFTLGLATYYIGNYINGSTTLANYDMCELIIYEGVLRDPQRIEVEKYLRLKWGIVDPPTPPPPPPAPFAPTDISGLYVWFDANNQSTVTIDGSSNVTSWSNLGLASNTLAPGSNNAKYTQDSNGNYVVSMPTEATLETYISLPYYSRTQFVVFENVDDLSTLSYPYQNLFVGNASGGVQTGISYDSNTSTYYMSLCQSGINCPISCDITAAFQIGGYNLAIYGVDSNDNSNSYGYYNSDNNINTSSDLGNLFNTSPIPFLTGSPVSDSPDFRIGEILEYDSLLSAANVSTVTNYLITKWAISSFAFK